MVGPVFWREAATAPRRPRHYLFRGVYVTALLVLMCTAWLLVTGAQLVRDVGDMARFGALLFQILAPLQVTLVLFLAALTAASAVAQEKDRRTLVLLLLTRVSNVQLVVGKLLASLLDVLVMLAAAVPVFLFVPWFGGVSAVQALRVSAVSLAAALAAGSWGCMVALWRDKTFQTLAITAAGLLLWAGAGEAAQLLGGPLWGAAISPFRAVFEAARPRLPDAAAVGWTRDGAMLFVLASLAWTAVLNGIAIARVRVWNPSRDVRPGQREREGIETIWGEGGEAAGAGGLEDQEQAERARADHVDARRPGRPAGPSRRVWDNPILWREMRTWAYGRKVILIRLAYLALLAMTLAGIHAALAEPRAAAAGYSAVLPPAAKPLAPFLLISLVMINALAVTSITTERDGLSLDLLLVTDLSPREFVLGKLGGVLWVAKEMVLAPAGVCLYLAWQGALGGENLVLLLAGLAVLIVFVAMLGVHCGMSYANSRTAIGVSMGAVFLLFLGVAACIALMIAFSGSFQQQLAPFLAFILGGSVALYAALGVRNPSPAIGLASLLLPLATFYAITSFLLDRPLAVFLVTAAVYGFTTAAMLIPAISEFDIAMGRTRAAADQ